ncbi:hypothetical protein Y032_0227g2820 [Ancylostoma ceylanicum]|uniref:Sulfhydryl oxidase n=1 Tax=Ancylostoma ceylanicum TaxID=53326 RepID=A0A016SGT4_9BILA|nr:hypothetical protein Y032_0227g2820 [Ancylostoma ceylanicum]
MLLRCLLAVSCLTLFLLVNGEPLYDASDSILELDVDTFNGAVYNSDKAHFIEFYSSWCGACIAYAPTFKQFARRLASWKPFVQVTGVNCADDKNMPLCREHSVNGFPTIKFFKRRAADKDDGQVYQGNKYELDQMERDVAAYVQADYEKQKHKLSEIFEPVDNSKSLADMWASAGSVNFLGVAVQENPANMAWALIINFYKDRNVRIVLTRPQHPEVVKQLGADANNRFLLYRRGESTPVWTSPNDAKWSDIQDKVNELITEGQGVVVPPKTDDAANKPVAVEPQAPAPVENIDMSQYQVQLVDLKSTISYMLFQEVPRRQVIDGEDLQGLKQWIRAMSKYAPGTTPMRRLLYRMNEWLQAQGESITYDDWTKKLEEIHSDLGNPLPKKIEWLACAGSKPNLRGYTCGVWVLAHAMAAEAYKTEEHNSTFNPLEEVLEPFHQFIIRFLSCEWCAKNFRKEVVSHKLNEVSTRAEMVLWLWRVHNFVNARLVGYHSDDPKFPKRQFPPSVLCGECYDANGVFDEKEILKFLVRYYSDIRQDTIQAPPEYKVNAYKDGKLQGVASRHLNPKFAVHAEKVGKLEEAEERLRKELDASPQRQWRDIEGYENLSSYTSGSKQFYFVWLMVIGIVIVFAYCKYRRNRSKFWKTFYYHNDFKL